jgi:phage-related protein
MIVTQLFELFGTVLLKGDKDVHSGLDSIDKKGQSVGKSMGLSFSNIAGAALKLAGILGLGLGIKTVIDSAFAGQKNLAQMEAVLKSTGGVAGMTKDALIKLADSQSRVTTFSKGATMQAENMLLTFRHIGKDVFPETIKATEDMATAMKMDGTSAAKLLGKAMDDPQNGLTKLTRAGVLFTDAQKEQIIAMQKAGDTAGAQKIILGELEKEFGGSAEAAGKTFPGQLQILQNALTSTGGAVVNAVLPAITNFVKMINNNMPKIQATIKGVVDAIVPKFQEWIKLIGQIANELFPNLGKATDGVKGKTSLFKAVLDDITKVLTFVKDNIGLVKAALILAGAIWVIQTGFVLAHNLALAAHNLLVNATAIVTGIAAAANWLFAASTWAVLLPILAVIAAVALLAFGVYELIKNWSTVKEFFVNLWNYIFSVFDGNRSLIYDTVVDLWNSVKDFSTSVWNGIVSVVMGIINAFVNGITNIFNSMKDGLDKIMQGLSNVFGGIWDVIKNIFLGAVLLILDLVTGNFGKLKTDAEGIFHNLSDAFGQIWDGIKQIFTGAGQAISGLLTLLWTGIKNDAISAWNSLKDAVISIVGLLVSGAINTFNGIVNFFRNLPGTLRDLGVNAFNGLKNGITSVLSTLGGVVSSGFNGAISFIKSLPGQALQWGVDFINGLKNGIINALGALLQSVKNVANSIADAVRGTLGIKSPSKVMAEIGGYTVQGLAKGIIDSKGLVTDAISGLGSDMSIGLKVNPAMAGGGSASNKASGGSESTGKVMNMTVNNYSPTALTPSEIARQVRMAWQQAALQY